MCIGAGRVGGGGGGGGKIREIWVGSMRSAEKNASCTDAREVAQGFSGGGWLGTVGSGGLQIGAAGWVGGGGRGAGGGGQGGKMWVGVC